MEFGGINEKRDYVREHSELIAKYAKDCYGKDIAVEVIMEYPTDKRVGLHWEALAYFRVRGWCRSLDEIVDPKQGDWAHVVWREGNTVHFTQHKFWDGQWVSGGGADSGMYK